MKPIKAATLSFVTSYVEGNMDDIVDFMLEVYADDYGVELNREEILEDVQNIIKLLDYILDGIGHDDDCPHNHRQIDEESDSEEEGNYLFPITKRTKIH